MNEQVKIFLSEAIIDMLQHHVSLKLLNKNKIREVIGKKVFRYNGYFDEPPTFACAIGKPQKEWLLIFIHEYCHFCQWKEKEPKYLKVDKTKGMEDYDNWLAYKAELSPQVVKKCTRVVQEMELDCEKRVVEIIQNYQLPFDIKDYIKKANSYILFYNMVLKHRKWCKKKSPHEIQEIIDIMPDHWLNCYTRTPKKFEELILKHVFKGKY